MTGFPEIVQNTKTSRYPKLDHGTLTPLSWLEEEETPAETAVDTGSWKQMTTDAHRTCHPPVLHDALGPQLPSSST